MERLSAVWIITYLIWNSAIKSVSIADATVHRKVLKKCRPDELISVIY